MDLRPNALDSASLTLGAWVTSPVFFLFFFKVCVYMCITLSVSSWHLSLRVSVLSPSWAQSSQRAANIVPSIPKPAKGSCPQQEGSSTLLRITEQARHAVSKSNSLNLLIYCPGTGRTTQFKKVFALETDARRVPQQPALPVPAKWTCLQRSTLPALL